jgi:hypothetical protein
VTAVLGALTARKDAYERSIRAVDMISDGRLAHARHCVGSLVYDYAEHLMSGQRFPLTLEQTEARIEDVFTLLWGATRLNAVRRSIGLR